MNTVGRLCWVAFGKLSWILHTGKQEQNTSTVLQDINVIWSNCTFCQIRLHYKPWRLRLILSIFCVVFHYKKNSNKYFWLQKYIYNVAVSFSIFNQSNFIKFKSYCKLSIWRTSCITRTALKVLSTLILSIANLE